MDRYFRIWDRKKLAETLFKFDIGSLIHGVFLSKKELAGGRLRIARALSVFIEASNVDVASSGGVKNDHVHPGKVDGDPKNHFGNIPFSRDEYVAESIFCHVNVDLAQIRGYGLDAKATELLIWLALYRLRKLLDGDLRLRTACDLEPIDREVIEAKRPVGYRLPSLADLESSLASAIEKCKGMMEHTTVTFEDDLKKAKESKDDKSTEEDDADSDSDEQ